MVEVSLDRLRQVDVEALGHPEPGHGVVDGDGLVGELVHDERHDAHRRRVHREGSERKRSLT